MGAEAWAVILLIIIWLFIVTLAVANLMDREHDRSQSESVDWSKTPKQLQAEYWRWRAIAECAERRLHEDEERRRGR